MLDRVRRPEPSPNLDLPQDDAARLQTLHCRDLSLVVSGKRLLSDIALSLAPGSFTAILGPNGAGKSLLLRLLHGLIEPSTGEIRWGGLVLDETVRRRQAMVFQKPVLLRRSVAANIDFVLRLKQPYARAGRDEMLARVGLTELARQPARLLSGGEQQRLALACALAGDPQVLFLDEPTASLDPASVAWFEAIVRDAHRRGTKVIFVTHELGQAKRLADEVVFLDRGRLAEHTAAQTFFTEPGSEAGRAYVQGRLIV